MAMKKYEKIYKELRKKYSDEEIADSMMIPQDMTEDELKKSNREIKAFRFKLLSDRTEEQRVHSELLRFKFLMKDYLKKSIYSDEYSFGKHVSEYVRILNRTKKSLSEDLDVHYTRLSRIINDREYPNIELIYRLEKHSGGLIPALYWWKLVAKKQEFIIKQDNITRKRESSRVKNAMRFRA